MSTLVTFDLHSKGKLGKNSSRYDLLSELYHDILNSVNVEH